MNTIHSQAPPISFHYASGEHNLYLNNFHHLNIHSWRSVKFLTMTEKVVHLKILRTIKKNKLKQTDEQ